MHVVWDGNPLSVLVACFASSAYFCTGVTLSSVQHAIFINDDHVWMDFCFLTCSTCRLHVLVYTPSDQTLLLNRAPVPHVKSGRNRLHHQHLSVVPGEPSFRSHFLYFFFVTSMLLRTAAFMSSTHSRSFWFHVSNERLSAYPKRLRLDDQMWRRVAALLAGLYRPVRWL